MADVIKHLMRLGLSEYEARAYVATVSLGEGTVNEISKESGVTPLPVPMTSWSVGPEGVRRDGEHHTALLPGQ